MEAIRKMEVFIKHIRLDTKRSTKYFTQNKVNKTKQKVIIETKLQIKYKM